LFETPLTPPELLEEYRKMLEQNHEDDHCVDLSPRIRCIPGKTLFMIVASIDVDKDYELS
jgi:hypothetical protein